MWLGEDKLYIFQVNQSRHNPDTHQIEYKLSEQCVYFDKGRAIYYRGFTSHYILIGFLQMLFTEPVRSIILQSARSRDDVFVLPEEGVAIVWTGVWDNLERAGLIGVTFNGKVLNDIINDIYRSMAEHDGKLVDRN